MDQMNSAALFPCQAIGIKRLVKHAFTDSYCLCPGQAVTAQMAPGVVDRSYGEQMPESGFWNLPLCDKLDPVDAPPAARPGAVAG